MNLGPYSYILWFAVLIASLIVAGIHVSRRGSQGLKSALAAIIGAVLTWAFVSAYIGVAELDHYIRSWAFVVSVCLGILGLLLLFRSIRALKGR